MSDCEHRHTHPFHCDDCGAPWCVICRTYHPNRGLNECVADLRSRLATAERERDEARAAHRESMLRTMAACETILVEPERAKEIATMLHEQSYETEATITGPAGTEGK